MSRAPRQRTTTLLLAAAIAAVAVPLYAGMPAPLPTTYTADGTQPLANPPEALAADARWQALSFFLACLFVSTWGLKLLWNAARRDVVWLPEIRYGRALSLVVLWGVLFVIVLTMISGARELMTPGAWERQGATYRLKGAGN